jgi:hypothetical protein
MYSLSHFKMLVLSGDEDISTVPNPMTQHCLSQLKSGMRGQLLRPWKRWVHHGVTAGYSEAFERYMFATVRGAGHTVPQYQPLLTHQAFERWIAGVDGENAAISLDVDVDVDVGGM